MLGFRFLRETFIASGRASQSSHRDLHILWARRSAGFIAAAIALSALFQPPAVAITINIEYSTDFGGDESPSWDANGAILIAHFQAAKQIWEALLPGEGEISFDFQWDDDIDGLGLYTPIPFFEYIEINPDRNWFADPTPNDSSEFDVPVQTLYNQVSPELQSSHFPFTKPPGALEVGYLGAGLPNGALVNGMPVNTVSASGQIIPGTNPEQVDANNGYDLLSTVLHEIGHALGLSGIEPGNYNILPQHVGGLENVEVLEGGGGHLAGQGNVPYLMCEMCGDLGARRFATATDILVIAEELGVTQVRLERVGTATSGVWSSPNTWIGGAVPGITQDVYITDVGDVDLDTSASARNLTIAGSDDLDVAGHTLTVASTLKFGDGTISVGAGGLLSAGDIRFDGGALSAGGGGTISADAIHGDPATLTTAAGSTIEFNNFTRGASSATAATFNGSVKIGVGDGEELVSFNPNAIATWNIGQTLAVGDFQQPAQLVIDNGTWTVGGNLTLQNGGVIVDAGVFLGPGSFSGGSLEVTGTVAIGGGSGMVYRGRAASNTTYTIGGGGTGIKHIPPTPPELIHSPGGEMTFENITGGFAASANSATFVVGGGNGDGGPGGVVTFKDTSFADNAEVSTLAGTGGVSLRISNPVVVAGEGGRVKFENNSSAQGGFYSNYGVDAHGASDSGGATVFYNDSKALGATFDNYGSTLQSYIGGVPAPGGRTVFTDNAQVERSTFYNHPGQGMGSLGAGITVFSGESNADSSLSFTRATYTNLGGVPGAQFGGATEFYGTATAGKAFFFNQHAVGVTQHAGSAGNVRFYGSSTAGDATFYNQVGGGAVFFNESSNAGDAHFFIEDTGTGTFGGHVVFNGNSKGGTSDITIRENAFSATVEFRGTSNAENAEITLVNGSQAYVLVTNSASLGSQANLVDIGAGGSMNFRESASAGNSTIRLRPGGGADFTGTSTTAANSTITLDGATVANGGTGYLNFSGGNGGNATIYVNGGTVSGAAGAQIGFNNGANAGTATVIGGGAGGAGAGGARISLDASSTAANATFTIGAGGYLNLAGFGDAAVGSLDVEGGAVHLGQTGLRIGALDTSNTISGPITGFFGNGNAKITKVGAGTLTLTGANTYYGLTKVDGGTLAINGSTPGAVEVNSGAMLMGTGSIGGTVTLNSDGTLAPGASAGTVTIGGLAMTPDSSLEFELGAAAYDRIIASGNLALAGTLNIFLIDGFMPALGGMFELFNWATRSGTFSDVNLPLLAAGLSWDTTQLYTSGMISITAAAGVSGDYNDNGVVDAADYTLWRDQLGAIGLDPFEGADANGDGMVTQVDYEIWRSNFGATASGVLQAGAAAVPEPSCLLLALCGTAAAIRAARRR